MALIRCKKCGNPASSRSKACPICGEPIASEVAVENTPSTAESTPQSTSSAPKTLNDILAEGHASQPQTLNERLAASQGSAEESQPATEPQPEKESVAEPKPVVPPVVQ